MGAFTEELLAQSTLGGSSSTFTCSSVIGPSIGQAHSSKSSLGRGNSTISSSSEASEASRFASFLIFKFLAGEFLSLFYGSWPSIDLEYKSGFFQLNRVNFNNISGGHGRQLRRGMYSPIKNSSSTEDKEIFFESAHN